MKTALPEKLSDEARKGIIKLIPNRQAAARFCDYVQELWDWRRPELQFTTPDNRNRRDAKEMLDRTAKCVRELADGGSDAAALARRALREPWHTMHTVRLGAGMTAAEFRFWGKMDAEKDMRATLRGIVDAIEAAGKTRLLQRHRAGNKVDPFECVFWACIAKEYHACTGRKPSAGTDGPFHRLCIAVARGLGISEPGRRILANALNPKAQAKAR